MGGIVECARTGFGMDGYPPRITNIMIHKHKQKPYHGNSCDSNSSLESPQRFGINAERMDRDRREVIRVYTGLYGDYDTGEPPKTP
jgi:hypothetical protein